MKVARWRAGASGLLAGLGFLVATRLATLAGQAEIAGSEQVHLRAGPSTDQAVVATLSAGDVVSILDIEGSWTKVETQDGKVGFVYHRYVVPRVDGASGRPTGGRSEAPRTVATAATVGMDRSESVTTPAVPMLPNGDEIAAEVAGLRVEIAELKQKIQDRSAELAVDRAAALVTAVDERATANPVFAREQSAGVLVVALLSLLVGWVLGSAFTRRRNRSQRPRLRF